MRAIHRASFVFVTAAGLLLGGCATKESVEQAQSTADSARTDAASARSAADRAQTSADSAAKMAQDAMSLAQTANDKVDKVIADLEARKHKVRHRRHRTAAATPAPYTNPECPPTEERKTELLRMKTKQAALPAKAVPSKSRKIVHQAALPERTARN